MSQGNRDSAAAGEAFRVHSAAAGNSPDEPITHAEMAELERIIRPSRFRLIDAAAAPDNVQRARQWCQQHGAEIEFGDGLYTCTRDGEVLATAMDLAVLLGKLADQEVADA